MSTVATVARLHRVLPASREYAATWLEVDLCEHDLGHAGLCMLPGGHGGSCLPIPDGYLPEDVPGFGVHLRESVDSALTVAGMVGCLFAGYGLLAVMER